MKFSSQLNHQIKLIAIVAGLAFTLSAGISMAEEAETTYKRQGLFIGVNAGFGGATVGYKDGSQSIFEEAKDGASGVFRIGLGLSKYFSLGLEGHGFGSSDNSGQDWKLGASLIAITWYPGGGDFFVRTGFGGGGGSFSRPVTGQKITIKNRASAMFSLGYDWWVSKSMTLGIEATSFGLNAGGLTGFENDLIGTSSLSVQFNWYL